MSNVLIVAEGCAPVRPLFKGGLAAKSKKLVCEYMQEHLRETIPLKTLASIAGLSPFYFSHAFKVSFGLPPKRYFMKMKAERAKELLSTTNLPIGEIALELGFSEHSSLTALFRKMTGTTPKEYRRKAQANHA